MRPPANVLVRDRATHVNTMMMEKLDFSTNTHSAANLQRQTLACAQQRDRNESRGGESYKQQAAAPFRREMARVAEWELRFSHLRYSQVRYAPKRILWRRQPLLHQEVRCSR